jgi:hypothetical protein
MSYFRRPERLTQPGSAMRAPTSTKTPRSHVSARELRITPWTCEFCHKPIAPGDGAVQLRARDENGTVHGYPTNPTPDSGDMDDSPSQTISWLRGRVAMNVTHFDCDPNKDRPSYQIAIERVMTLEQWCARALQLHEMTWMGKRDLFLFMALWFTNRKIEYSDLA